MRCVLSFLIVLFSTSMASATDLSTDVDCPLPSVAKILAGEDRNVTKGSELEARLLADAADGRLDELSPIEAALIAGGVETTESLRRYCRKTTALGKWVCRSIDAAMSPRDRAEAVFDFLHRRVFAWRIRIERNRFAPDARSRAVQLRHGHRSVQLPGRPRGAGMSRPTDARPRDEPRHAARRVAGRGNHLPAVVHK